MPQLQPLAKINAIGILSNECGSLGIEPLQRFLSQLVDKQDVFDVEDQLRSGQESPRNMKKFIHPFSAQAPFENEHRRIFAI